jgi:uncharacterized membrane protein YbhN (UPF0104 family)
MKKFISIVVSLTILAIIYWKIDFPKLVQVLQNCDRWWMAIGLFMVVPLTMLTAWRLQQLMPTTTRLGFGEANRLILAASVLNMVLPSKMGDIVSIKNEKKGDSSHLLRIAGTSITIWFGHLLQIWFFILALKAWTPFLAHLAISPLAILAGLLPLTFAGVGTRDAALIAFYQPYLYASTAAALGLLCTSRYLLPAIGGLPFLGQYLTAVKKMRRE